jgi:hypothetical protein
VKNNFYVAFTWHSSSAREARAQRVVGVVDNAVAEIVVAILRHFSDNGGQGDSSRKGLHAAPVNEKVQNETTSLPPPTIKALHRLSPLPA